MGPPPGGWHGGQPRGSWVQAEEEARPLQQGQRAQCMFLITSQSATTQTALKGRKKMISLIQWPITGGPITYTRIYFQDCAFTID